MYGVCNKICETSKRWEFHEELRLKERKEMYKSLKREVFNKVNQTPKYDSDRQTVNKVVVKKFT